MEGGGAGDQLNVLLCAAQLERQLRRRQGADDVVEKPRWQNNRAGALGLRLELGHIVFADRTMRVLRKSAELGLAAIITPDSAWTALRVDATRVTVCSCANSSVVGRESFIDVAI